jgi:hypothetical protein
MSLKPTVRDAKVAGVLLVGAAIIYGGYWGFKKLFGKKEDAKPDSKAA